VREAKERTNPVAVGCAVLLIAAVGVLVVGILSREPAPSSGVTGAGTNRRTSQQSLPVEPQLELLKYSWHIEYGYAILEGQVKNTSSRPLVNVLALASFYDASDGFITSADAIIEFNPILPGQISPFRVMATRNPAMKKAAVEFKYLMGGSIPSRNAERK